MVPLADRGVCRRGRQRVGVASARGLLGRSPLSAARCIGAVVAGDRSCVFLRGLRLRSGDVSGVESLAFFSVGCACVPATWLG